MTATPYNSEATSPAERDQSPASIASLAASWVSTAGARAKVTTELALAEARLAVLSLALMGLFTIVAAVLALSVWGLVLAVIALALVQTGMPLWAVLAVLLVVQSTAALFAWRRVVQLSAQVEFPETRAQLSLYDSEVANAETTATTH